MVVIPHINSKREINFKIFDQQAKYLTDSVSFIRMNNTKTKWINAKNSPKKGR